MNTEIIKTFLKVVEFKSVTSAAEALYLSQSTVSHRLKQLEDFLGDTLVVRSKGRHGIELTPRGVAFIPLAERWISLSKDTEQFQNFSIKQDLIIGGIDSVNAYSLSKLFCDVANLPSHPINLDLRTHHSYQIQLAVENHEIDIGFLVRKYSSRNLIFRPVFSERYLIVGDFGSNIDMCINPHQLDPSYEVISTCSTDYSDWHNFYFDTAIVPWAEVDSPALLSVFLQQPKTWAIVTESVAEFLKSAYGMSSYNLSSPPPDRVCYEVSHRFPLENKLGIMRQFDEILDTFIDSNPFLLK